MENQLNSTNNAAQQAEIITLLRQQNEMLRNLTGLVQYTLEAENQNRYRVRANVIDLDMSIGSMIGFLFKWLIASIPVGIVVGIVYAIIIAIAGGF